MESLRSIRVIRCCSKLIRSKLVWRINCFLFPGVFLDSKKVLNTVDHFILLHRLYHNGIRDIMNDWFSFYRSHRFQATQTESYSYIPNKRKISCVAPQGSFIGQLLSLIKINDRHIHSDIFDCLLFLLKAPA